MTLIFIFLLSFFIYQVVIFFIKLYKDKTSVGRFFYSESNPFIDLKYVYLIEEREENIFVYFYNKLPKDNNIKDKERYCSLKLLAKDSIEAINFKKTWKQYQSKNNSGLNFFVKTKVNQLFFVTKALYLLIYYCVVEASFIFLIAIICFVFSYLNATPDVKHCWLFPFVQYFSTIAFPVILLIYQKLDYTFSVKLKNLPFLYSFEYNSVPMPKTYERDNLFNIEQEKYLNSGIYQFDGVEYREDKETKKMIKLYHSFSVTNYGLKVFALATFKFHLFVFLNPFSEMTYVEFINRYHSFLATCKKHKLQMFDIIRFVFFNDEYCSKNKESKK